MNLDGKLDNVCRLTLVRKLRITSCCRLRNGSNPWGENILSSQKENDVNNAMIAYIAPFAMFMILTPLETFKAFIPYYLDLRGEDRCHPRDLFLVCRKTPVARVLDQRIWTGRSVRNFGLVVWVGLSELSLEQRLIEVAPFLKSMIGERVGYNFWKEIPSLPVAIAFFSRFD